METKEFEETLWIKFWYSFFRVFMGPIVRLFWIKKVEGLENIPKSGPCIIAANHASYLDFICFVSISPRKVYYLAAEKFFKSYFWRPLMNMTGQIKVERDVKDKTKPKNIAISVLKQNKMLGIFPEGTRSDDGEIHKAYTGVAKFVLATKAPVIPMGIKETYKILPRFKKTPKFKKIAEFVIGKPMFFENFYCEENDEKVLREITNKIMLEIAKLANKKYNYAE
jgi:1-acyl-sn-glycerol-3-phosphate acyltransferase